MILTQQQLQKTFCDNFLCYFRSQVAHVNVVGRNFYSDHKLLGKIYEHLQANALVSPPVFPSLLGMVQASTASM